jgi:multidrug efflux pump subunit AcrB
MLRNKMSDAVPELPGTNGPFVNDEFGLTALATIALWSDGFSLEEMRRVARDARRRLDSLAGVERIELFGVQPERIFLTASNTRLASLGIPPQAIVDTLQAQNIILPGGTINAAGQSVRIEASGTFGRHRYRGRAGADLRLGEDDRAKGHRRSGARVCRPGAAAGVLQRTAGDRPQRLHPRRCQRGGVWPPPEARPWFEFRRCSWYAFREFDKECAFAG